MELALIQLTISQLLAMVATPVQTVWHTALEFCYSCVQLCLRMELEPMLANKICSKTVWKLVLLVLQELPGWQWFSDDRSLKWFSHRLHAGATVEWEILQ